MNQQASAATTTPLTGVAKREQELRAELAEIENARESRETGFLELLKEAGLELPHPNENEIEATMANPRIYALVFRTDEDGKNIVDINPVSKKIAGTGGPRTARTGPAKREMSEYGLQPGDVVVRPITTAGNARQSGMAEDATVEMKVLDNSIGESTNCHGQSKQGSLTATGRHALGGGNKSGLFEPSLDGPRFWLKDESVRVRRGSKTLRTNKETGRVVG